MHLPNHLSRGSVTSASRKFQSVSSAAVFTARLPSKDPEEGHQMHSVATAAQEGLMLAADLGWIGTGKVKARGLQSCSVNPSLETVSLNFPFPVVKITARTLGNTWL